MLQGAELVKVDYFKYIGSKYEAINGSVGYIYRSEGNIMQTEWSR